MSDLLVRNLAPETLAWLKARAEKSSRSLSDEAKVIMTRRLMHDGDLPPADALALLREFGEVETP